MLTKLNLSIFNCAFCWIILSSTGRVCCSANAGESLRTESGELWRQANACGINSAYLMLKAVHPLGPSYSEFSMKFDSGGTGTRFSEIQKVLVGFGLRCRVVKAKPQELASLPFPVVAHIERQDSRVFESAGRGHYVVLLDASTGVRYIDGTTADIVTTDMATFVRGWSGYLLVAESDSLGLSYSALGNLLVLGSLVGFAIAFLRRFLAKRKIVRETGTPVRCP